MNNQGIVFPLADLATQMDGARLLTWRASWMAANGISFERGEGSMSKLAASEVAVKTTERALQTIGGYITDHRVEKWYRDAKLYNIFEGTRDSADCQISGAGGRRRCSAAACGHRALRGTVEPDVRSQRTTAIPSGRCRTVHAGSQPRAGQADSDERAAATS